MEDNKGCQIHGIFAPPCEITIKLIVNRVTKISLLEQRSLGGLGLSFGKESRESGYTLSVMSLVGLKWNCRLTGIDRPQPKLVHHQQFAVSKLSLGFILQLLGSRLLFLFLDHLVQ